MPKEGERKVLRVCRKCEVVRVQRKFKACAEREAKVRIKELVKYRDHGLRKNADQVPFECERYKRELKVKRLAKSKTLFNPDIVVPGSRFLPQHGDYSLRAILGLDPEEKPAPVGGVGKNKKAKKSKWARKKLKTGRRLLLQQGCILTLASPKRRDSTDSGTN